MRQRIAEMAQVRAALLADALRETAEADLPPGVRVERTEDGIAFSGRGLARLIAFDGRLRGFGQQIGRAE